MVYTTPPRIVTQRNNAIYQRYLDELEIERFDWMRFTDSADVTIKIVRKELNQNKQP